jgi:hypothetical protein
VSREAASVGALVSLFARARQLTHNLSLVMRRLDRRIE